MSFKEVKQLRIQGKLDEALQLAERDFNNEPSNIWNIRSLSWVYYDLIKLYVNNDQLMDIYLCFDKIMELNISLEDKKMLYEKISFQIGKIVYKLNSYAIINYKEIDRIFEYLKNLKTEDQVFLNSFLIKAFVKGAASWNHFFSFVDYVGFDSFQENDYHAEKYNEREIPSLVEKFYNAYAKKLIASASSPDFSKFEFERRVNEFLPRLNNLILIKKEYQFLPYFKAKLLIQLNRNDEVLFDFIPFAKRKKIIFGFGN
jgi:hypothetical protein